MELCDIEIYQALITQVILVYTVNSLLVFVISWRWLTSLIKSYSYP